MSQPTPRRLFDRIVPFLLAATLAACGGGGGGGGEPAPAGNVGPAGATVASADGHASLSVPAGAVNSTLNVTLAPASDGYRADDQIVPGTVYRLDAPQAALGQPATLALAVPDGLSAPAVARERQHALAVVAPLGLVGCYLRQFSAGSGYSYLPLPAPAGTNVPPPTTPGDFSTVCVYDQFIYRFPNACPTGFVSIAGGFWTAPSYFTPTAPGTVPLGSNSGQGQVSLCSPAPAPQPQVATLSPDAVPALLPTIVGLSPHAATVSLGSLGPAIFGIVYDHTPPVVQLTSETTVIPVGNGMAKLRLVATASDNTGVTRVGFVKWTSAAAPNLITKADLASFVAGPYQWESAPMPYEQVYGSSYLATAEDAAGNIATATMYLSQTTPSITGFSVSPATLPYGGGDVTLSWSIPPQTSYGNYPNELHVDQGVGDVTGLTSKTVHVDATTTFTLTASNTAGLGTATATVTVGPQPAPTIGSFGASPPSLPPGGGTVTLAWTVANAGALSIDHGVGNVTGLSSKAVNVSSTTTFELNASNANGTAQPAYTTVVVATDGDRFVDVGAGSDANACSQAAPCKTIAKAASGAAAGSTIYLADGSYGSTTQGSGATIPDGVTLRAINVGAATLAKVPLSFAGSGSLVGVVLDQENGTCASVSASATAGSPTLAIGGVLIRCLGALNLGGNVAATMSPGGLAGELYTAGLPGGYNPVIALTGSAQLRVQGGVFNGNNVGAAAFGGGFITVAASASLTLDHATLRNRLGVGLSLAGNASAVLHNGALIDHVGAAGNCRTAASIVIDGAVNLQLDQAQISNSPNSAICVGGGFPGATLVLNQSTLSNNASGVSSDGGGTPSSATLTATGTSLIGNGYGINWTDAGNSHFELSGLTVTGNGTGIQLTPAATGSSFKLRNSTLSNNSSAGVALFYHGIDLGSSADPGGNTFTGNAGTGLKANINAGESCQAVGNTWIPGQQGADANGHYSVGQAYTPVPKTGPASGKNYSMAYAASLDL